MAQSPYVVGVLALQGAFMKHLEMVKKAGGLVIEVKKPQDLAKCDGLIIPGGESTTISRLLSFIELIDPIKEFAKKKPLFGTCAGLIIMSHEILGNHVGNHTGETIFKSFDLLKITVERNAFGRQVESFQADVQVSLKPGVSTPTHAFFIRAPRIRKLSPEVKVLAEFNGEPVLVQQGIHLGATFHPELGGQHLLHSYFLKLIQGQ